jgi:hypothetical protein
VGELWERAAQERAQVRCHDAPVVTALLVALAHAARRVPALVLPAAGSSGADITSTEELRAWSSRRCQDLLARSVASNDDRSGAAAVEAWTEVQRAVAIDNPTVSPQFVIVPEEVLVELAEVVRGALVVGPASTGAALQAVESIAVGERGFVTRQLTAAQTWSAALTGAVLEARRSATVPHWWRTGELGRRSAALAADACSFEAPLRWFPFHEVADTASMGIPSTPGVVRDPLFAAASELADGRHVLSFVVRSDDADRMGVCLWPPPGYEALRGPLPPPSTPPIVAAGASRLGVPMRDVFDTRSFTPPSVLPIDGGPRGLPDAAFWDDLAAAAGTSVVTLAGTLSADGLQVIVVLADRVTLPMPPVPWAVVLVPGPGDDGDDSG